MRTANDVDPDHFDPRRHLISDRALNRLVEQMERAEEAQRLTADAPADPLAEEVSLLRESAEAYAAWRGHQMPRGWRQGTTHTGLAWQRRGVQVVARLVPRLTPGVSTLTVEVSRPGGERATLSDMLGATEAFVPAEAVISVDAIDHGWPVLTARWAVRVLSAERRAA